MSIGVVEPSGGQKNYPGLAPNPNWVKGGPSPNPGGGKNKYAQALDKAIQAQESPEMVCQVIAAMREQALEKSKASPAAAKVYLAAVGVDLNKGAAKLDLDGAPKELVEGLIDWIGQNPS